MEKPVTWPARKRAWNKARVQLEDAGHWEWFMREVKKRMYAEGLEWGQAKWVVLEDYEKAIEDGTFVDDARAPVVLVDADDEGGGGGEEGLEDDSWRVPMALWDKEGAGVGMEEGKAAASGGLGGAYDENRVSVVKDIKWVYWNMGLKKPDVEHAPSPGAVAMLAFYRVSADRQQQFYKDVMPKCIGKAELNELERRVDGGEPVDRAIAALMRVGAEAVALAEGEG